MIGARAAAIRGNPTVACIEWIDPLMAAGNWMPELVALAGGVSLFGAAGRHSPWMTWERLAAADPGGIVVLPCGFHLERADCEAPAPAARPQRRGGPAPPPGPERPRCRPPPSQPPPARP